MPPGRANGAACFIVVGRKGAGLEPVRAAGVDAVFSLCPGPIGLGYALANAAPLLAEAAEDAVGAFLAGRRHHGLGE